MSQAAPSHPRALRLAPLLLVGLTACALSYDFDVEPPGEDVANIVEDVADTAPTVDADASGDTDTDDTDSADTSDVDDEPTCEDECEETETTCAGPTLRVCGLEDNGCWEWQPPIDCGQGTCEEGVCVCDEGQDPVGDVCGALAPGTACRCDASCEGTEVLEGACVAGVCMQLPADGCEGESCGDASTCVAIPLGDTTLEACVPQCEQTSCDGTCEDGLCWPSASTDRCDATCSEHCVPCGEHASVIGVDCVCDPGYADDGAGTCVCVDACEAGALRCDEDGQPQRCDVPDGATCTAWLDEAPCGGGASCADGVCSCEMACDPGTRRCADGLSFQVCEMVPGDACATWSDIATCSDGITDEVCEGDGVCLCRPNVGRICRVDDREIWTLDGCNGLEERVETCEWGCDPELELCYRGQTFADVEPGPYALGASRAELGASDNDMAYSVMIQRPYMVSTTEVTQAIYQTVMGTNPSVHLCADCPVENVTWVEATQFCNALSAREGLDRCYSHADTGGEELSVTFAGLDCDGYRLPTEAEWEIAARARTLTAVFTGDLTVLDGRDPLLDPIAVYGMSDGTPATVASLDANPWRIHDTSGNVWEWTWNWYRQDLNTADLLLDPIGPDFGARHTRRGGGYASPPAEVRSASREGTRLGFASSDTGFRIVRTLFDRDGDATYDDRDNCPGLTNDQTDRDEDGLGDACDACPLDALDDADGDGVCGDVDVCEGHDDAIDTDDDGVPDGCDPCPLAPLDDQDDDGLCDDVDVCPLDAENPDEDEDRVCDDVDVCLGHDDAIDTDDDGVPDGCDACPEDPLDDQDSDGVCDGADPCPTDPLDRDTDGDTVCDVDDVCPDFDDLGPDADGDTIPDACDACRDGDDRDDRDGDGTPDKCDGCPLNPGLVEDSDGDGVCVADNCPAVTNPLQRDTNGDGRGDACQTDDDGDAILDAGDNCPLVSNFAQTDTDGDDIGDACDGDFDADGVPDETDRCPNDPDPDDPDLDGDGVGDACDLNRDGDGFDNAVDVCPNDPADDEDGDGLCADVDPCPLEPENDADGDGLCPADELAAGTAVDNADTDEDGLSDGEEVLMWGTDPLVADTDGDGLSDTDEVAEWGSDPHVVDTDGDGLSDGDEVAVYGTHPDEDDSDFDGLNDGAEALVWGTDPLNPDTDGGGTSDGDEIAEGRDPLDPADDAPAG